MRPITTTVGPFVAGSSNAISLSQSLAAAGNLLINGALATGGVAKMDNPRNINITSSGNDTGLTWTVAGTNDAGNTISETIAGSNSTVVSVLSYATVTSISGSAATASTVTAGSDTGGVSPWVRFDEWADGAVGLQCVVSGTVVYSFESSFDDPNSLISPVVPASMTWDSTISPIVGAATSQMASLTTAPLWGRINLASGTGSVKGTFVQYLQVPTS